MNKEKEFRLRLLKQLSKDNLKILEEYLETHIYLARLALEQTDDEIQIRNYQGQIRGDKRKLDEIRSLFKHD